MTLTSHILHKLVFRYLLYEESITGFNNNNKGYPV